MATPKEVLTEVLEVPDQITCLAVVYQTRGRTHFSLSEMDMGQLAYLSKYLDSVVTGKIFNAAETCNIVRSKD